MLYVNILHYSHQHYSRYIYQLKALQQMLRKLRRVKTFNDLVIDVSYGHIRKIVISLLFPIDINDIVLYV